MDGIPTLTNLLRQLQRVPYVASKNIQRVAQHFLTMEPEQLAAFCTILQDARRNLVPCKQCCAWQERTGQCIFCTSPKRTQSVICVVETWHDLCAIERSGGYAGLYHVLGGALCPLDGIGVDDLTVEVLLARLAARVGQERTEVVLAMNQTPEGEATASYVARALRNQNVVVTRLAQGVPAGSALEFTDRLTLCKAMAERKAF